MGKNIISGVGGLIKRLTDKSYKKTFTSAVILAAGSGKRMMSDTTKQWLTLDGVPIVARSLLQFQASPLIDEIVLCVKEDEMPLYSDFAELYGLSKLKAVVCGGETRQLSALEGFKKISDKAELVAIHDAARCLVTLPMIEKTVRAARVSGCACAATKAKDTVKIAAKKELISETPDRELVWLAQTPQVFDVEAYRASVYTCINEGFTGTDDASLLEHCGFKVRLVDCGAENIKITEPIDMYIAEAILRRRADSEAAAENGASPREKGLHFRKKGNGEAK